jgi:hypothetical protein
MTHPIPPASLSDLPRRQNVESLEAHGFKKAEGYDDEGNRLIIWWRGDSKGNVFGMWPDAGDTLPYLINLFTEGGFFLSKPITQGSELKAALESQRDIREKVSALPTNLTATGFSTREDYNSAIEMVEDFKASVLKILHAVSTTALSLDLGTVFVRCDGCLALSACDKKWKCPRYRQWSGKKNA